MTEFWVPGVPATKGSWRNYGGKMVADNAREKPWANAVGWAARMVRASELVCPVSVEIDCFYPRPKRPTHPFPARNDVDKAARSCLDALTGICWRDDEQVVRLLVTKQFAIERGPGASIRVGAQ